MRKIFILVGISGSGKTTYRKELIDSFDKKDNFLIINRDDLRKSIFGDLTNYYRQESKVLKQKENLITELTLEMLHQADFELENYHLIHDNTNLDIDIIDDVVTTFESNECEIKVIVFIEDAEKCRQNVMKRDNLSYSDTLYILAQEQKLDNLLKILVKRGYDLEIKDKTQIKR